MGPKTCAAIATVLWGFTYIVSTSLLPANPFFIATLRALGAAAILLAIARQVPPKAWIGRIVVLGTLNAGLFFGMLFIAALRLPGGIAAIFQSLGPVCAILLGWAILGSRPTPGKIVSVLLGAVGVTLVVFKGKTDLDPIGVMAALIATVSLALGGILMNRWGKPPVKLLAYTGWQLLIAGIELLIVTLALNDLPTALTATHALGFAILAVVLTAVPFALWFRAIAGAGAVAVAPYFLLVPVTAFILDALITGFVPSFAQSAGAAIVLGSLIMNQLPIGNWKFSFGRARICG